MPEGICEGCDKQVVDYTGTDCVAEPCNAYQALLRIRETLNGTKAKWVETGHMKNFALSLIDKELKGGKE